MTKVNVPTKPFDPARHIETEEDAVVVLNDAFESGDPKVVASALGLIARSRGASAVAEAAGISRASLYSSLSSNGNPTLGMLIPVLDKLGMELSVKRKAA